MSEKIKSDVANVAESAHSRRISQLNDEGMGNYFLPADRWKSSIFPPESMPNPPPLLRSPGFGKDFHKFHGRLGGQLPPSGFYRFENVFVGQSGTIISADRHVLWSDDLISPYWMLFLSRMFRRDVLGESEDRGGVLPSSTVTGRFMAGQAVPIMEIEQGCTLVCLMKPGGAVYGHWVLDVLPLIWQLRRCVSAGHLKGPFRYLVNQTLEPWCLAMLKDLFDIELQDLVLVDSMNGMLHVNEVIVPSLLRVSPLISPKINDFVSYVLARMLPNFDGEMEQLPDRLFISRSAYATPANKMLTNNAEIIENMQGIGLGIIQPESIPWPRQLAIFSRAKLIVGEFGSGMHNSLFGDAGLKSIILGHMKQNWNQSSIAAIRGQRLSYVQPVQSKDEQRTGLGGAGIAYSFDPRLLIELINEISPSGKEGES